MTDLRKIDPSSFIDRDMVMRVRGDAGPKPALKWLAIADLRIDPVYQRGILKTGRKNIIKIAVEFDWAKFAPVIVAPTNGGGAPYAIIDGQHRTTAAALRRIAEVPCQIVSADRAKQAAAFAAINAQITVVSPLQLHAARLAAGDGHAKTLAAVCGRAGVTICRYPVPASSMKVGETLAVGVIARLLDRYGEDVLVSALACITETRSGNVGMVRAPVITALCTCFDAEPDWRKNHKRLIAAMQRFDFEQAFMAAGKASYVERVSITSKLVDAVADHLETALA